VASSFSSHFSLRNCPEIRGASAEAVTAQPQNIEINIPEPHDDYHMNNEDYPYCNLNLNNPESTMTRFPFRNNPIVLHKNGSLK